MPQVMASDTLTLAINRKNITISMVYNATSYGILGFLLVFF